MIERPRFRLMRRLMTAAWLTRGEGELVGYSLDIIKDTFVERVRLGLLARFPESAPADAVAAIGRDRRVLRGINESLATYVQRLIFWIDDRQTAGNAFALLKKLAEHLGPGVRVRTVDRRGNWYTRDVDGTYEVLLKEENWDWDSETHSQTALHADDSVSQRWSRFWVIIYPPTSLWTEGPSWDDPEGPEWGDPSYTGTWGSTAPIAHVRSVRSLVADWKPAGTRCQNIIIAFDPDSFDPLVTPGPGEMPDGFWGRWSKNVGGVQVPSRLATARYWDGV